VCDANRRFSSFAAPPTTSPAKIDVREKPVTLGTTCLVLSTIGLTLSGATAHPPRLVLWMLLLGMGAGLSMMPLTAAGLEAVEPDLVPQASAMRLLNKLLAQSMGVRASKLAGKASERLGAAQVMGQR
jgi:hypothetical protein